MEGSVIQDIEVQRGVANPLYALFRLPENTRLTKDGRKFVDMVLDKCKELAVKAYGAELENSALFKQTFDYFKSCPVVGTQEKLFFVLNILSMMPELQATFPSPHPGFYVGLEIMLQQALNHEWSDIDIKRTIDDMIHAAKMFALLPPVQNGD